MRRGLEDWLQERPGLPQGVVAQARVLADRLDDAPDDSPLHGRYTATMAMLLEADRESPLDVAAALAEIFEGS